MSQMSRPLRPVNGISGKGCQRRAALRRHADASSCRKFMISFAQPVIRPVSLGNTTSVQKEGARSHHQMLSPRVRYTCMITVHCRPLPHESNVTPSEACQWDFRQGLSTSCCTQAARGRVIMPKVYDFYRSASNSTSLTAIHIHARSCSFYIGREAQLQG